LRCTSEPGSRSIKLASNGVRSHSDRFQHSEVLSVIAFVSAVAFLLPIAMIVIGKCFLRRFNRVEGVFFVSVVKFNA